VHLRDVSRFEGEHLLQGLIRRAAQYLQDNGLTRGDSRVAEIEGPITAQITRQGQTPGAEVGSGLPLTPGLVMVSLGTGCLTARTVLATPMGFDRRPATPRLRLLRATTASPAPQAPGARRARIGLGAALDRGERAPPARLESPSRAVPEAHHRAMNDDGDNGAGGFLAA
jgi:hypothetical protein